MITEICPQILCLLLKNITFNGIVEIMTDPIEVKIAIECIVKLIESCNEISKKERIEKNKTRINELHCKLQEIYAELDSNVSILRKQLSLNAHLKESILNNLFKLLDYAIQNADDQKIKKILRELDKI